MIFKKRWLSKVANFSFTLNQLRQRTRRNNVYMMLWRASFIWFKNTIACVQPPLTSKKSEFLRWGAAVHRLKYNIFQKSVCRIIIIRISCVIRPIMKGGASYCFKFRNDIQINTHCSPVAIYGINYKGFHISIYSKKIWRKGLFSR